MIYNNENRRVSADIAMYAGAIFYGILVLAFAGCFTLGWNLLMAHVFGLPSIDGLGFLGIMLLAIATVGPYVLLRERK